MLVLREKDYGIDKCRSGYAGIKAKIIHEVKKCFSQCGTAILLICGLGDRRRLTTPFPPKDYPLWQQGELSPADTLLQRELGERK